MREEVESRVATAMQKAIRLEEQLEAAAEAHLAAVQKLEVKAGDLRQQLADAGQQESGLRQELTHAESLAARSALIRLPSLSAHVYRALLRYVLVCMMAPWAPCGLFCGTMASTQSISAWQPSLGCNRHGPDFVRCRPDWRNVRFE